MMRFSFNFSLPALCAAMAVSACTPANQPLNVFEPTLANTAPVLAGTAVEQSTQEVEGVGTNYVGLAFSGGGTRAAAFAYGMMQQMHETRLPGSDRPVTGDVRFISGVSGGSVFAAYYGLKGPASLQDFRQKFLLKNAEEYLRTSAVNPANIIAAVGGGINSRTGFAKWLDDNLFKGATFSALNRDPRLKVWINASDVFNRTPFTFEPEAFRALCSNLNRLPVAEGVAASAAVPIVFSPIVLKAYGPRCNFTEPPWLTTAKFSPEATATLKAYARALKNYRDPSKMKFVKLLDGAITDNFGVTGLSIARARSQTPYGPLTPREAVRLKRMLFMVANAGREIDADWANEVAGPSGLELVSAIANTAMDSATREGFDSFRSAMRNWQQDLINYRCALPKSTVKRLRGSLKGWNCRDLKIFVGQLRFDQLDAATEARLNEVPTRLKLPAAQVDLTIQAGRKTLAQHPVFQGYLTSIRGFDAAGKRRISASSNAPRFVAPDE
ncbi:MAG: patatin-like phospholipase family protein [Pseudomonadota bacterium]